MSKQRHYRQRDNGSFYIDDEQIRERNRDLAAHNDASDLGHIDQLGHAGSSHHKAGNIAFDGACNHTGKEHIRKADDDGLAGQLSLRQLQQLIKGNEGDTQNF